jgi:SAM-dependent methyltransferase
MICGECRHVQLGDTVHPDNLFRAYPFRSGASGGWRAHVDAFAQQQPNGEGRLAIDLGCNDGTLTGALSHRGYRVLGVDPSPAEQDWPVVTGYWNAELAGTVQEKYGRADLVTAWNVLGHVDDPVTFLAAVRRILADGGRLVVETPWVVPIIQRGTYDTFYHEHLNTWGLHALQLAGEQAGLVITELALLPVHGGSLRVTFKTQGSGPGHLMATLAHEERALRPMLLESFPFKVRDAQYRLNEWCAGHRQADDLMVGYGASARGMVLLNTCVELSSLQSIVDDTPEKQGLITPGVTIPIERPSKWLRGVDAMVALSYPWAGRMLEQARAWGFKGPMYVPFHGELT